jgi:hypothetical protein
LLLSGSCHLGRTCDALPAFIKPLQPWARACRALLAVIKPLQLWARACRALPAVIKPLRPEGVPSGTLLAVISKKLSRIP